MIDTDAHSPPVGLQLLDLGELHNRRPHVLEPLLREFGAGDVFGEGGQVDAGVLFGVAVGCYMD